VCNASPNEPRQTATNIGDQKARSHLEKQRCKPQQLLEIYRLMKMQHLAAASRRVAALSLCAQERA